MPSGRRRRRGTSLVEFMLASTLTLVGVASYLSAIIKVDDLRRASDESSQAFEAARLQLSVLQSTAFDELVRRYDNNSENDPEGPGTAPGATFEVKGLERHGAGPATAGQVFLPLDGAGALREDLELPELGLPRDLNGDGAIDGADHSADYVVLPILVRVRWDSHGVQSVDLKTILSAR